MINKIPQEDLKKLVWNSIKSQFGLERLIPKYDLVKEYPEYVIPTATFVTINKNGKLRGCIGSLVAHQELYNDLVINARKAAFNDPRFQPLKQEELKDISIEISILTPLKELNYSDIEDLLNKITPNKDGLLLRYKDKQGTYLPSVWEQIPKKEDFLNSLCHKAGLTPDVLKEHPQIFFYETIKVK
jgi:AmmeMemoRadiSam system protein A